jgi:D-alanyl-D-alanine carboxypeptidase/D-alanyl-D-alanine-endopeptidase (penicillin-binding protein 4)
MYRATPPPALLFLFLALVTLAPLHGASSLDLPKLVPNGSVRVEREDGSPIIQYRDAEQFVPASVLKIATALCALDNLGRDYYYETLFFSDGAGSLFIRGSGDPSLVSEILEGIAIELAKQMHSLDRIVIDTSLFDDDLRIDGSERSINPYDAKNAAFVGNYSSAQLTHTKQGTVLSAEPQTPLTSLARQAGLKLPRGKTDRVNLSSDWRVGVKYGGELLAAFLEKHGVRGPKQVQIGAVSGRAKEIYRHRSPQNLAEISQTMLKYSTNFTANQIFLTLGIHKFGEPATVEKGQQAMRECLLNSVGWRDFHVEEGSGLSRRNKVTAQQMTTLLRSFERYKFLLPEQQGFLAKTGSLRGVNSLAGYFYVPGEQQPLRFSILINSEVPHLYKFKVANELRSYLMQSDKKAQTRGK